MKKIILTLAAIVLMTTACTHQQTTGIVLENLDTTVIPQNDFYQFACGGWMANNPLTPEYSRFGSFDKLGLNNLEQVNGLIQSIAQKKHSHGSIEQKIGDFYNMAMDTARRDTEGIAPVQKTLDEIARISTREELSEVLGKAMDYGLWALYVDADAMNSSMNILNEYQAGFTLGEKEYYLDEDEQTTTIRNAYVAYVEKMFGLFGFDNAAEKAQTVLRLETRIAKAAYNNVELRDPQDHVTLAEKLSYMGVSRRELYDVYAAVLLLEKYGDQTADKNREEIIKRLCPIFYNDRDAAGTFLDDIRCMKAKEITARVNQLVDAGTISPLSKNRDLWAVLHDFGLYDKVEILAGDYKSNFNRVKDYINGVYEE